MTRITDPESFQATGRHINDVLREIEVESCWDTDWTRGRLEQALSAINGIARAALVGRTVPTADGGFRDIKKS